MERTSRGEGGGKETQIDERFGPGKRESREKDLLKYVKVLKFLTRDLPSSRPVLHPSL